MYRVFYDAIRLGDTVPGENSVSMSLLDIQQNVFPLVKEDKEYFGVVDSNETTLQAMYHEDQGEYWFEIPRPDMNGSFGKFMSFKEALELLKGLPLLFPIEGFDGFEFSKW